MTEVVRVKEENSKFEMRAPPRRRAKGEDPEEQPVFLRKAFTMISTCPPEIGGWSENGDTVIIKDVKLFSERIIPTSYKHNNFSSFVRQLNFYGFRKIKSESLENPSWWEFRHPNFLRGQPQLLSEIKRSVHFVPETASSKEVTDLKSHVSSLTDRVQSLNDQVDLLNTAVSKLQLDQQEKENNGVETIGKKRKTRLGGQSQPKANPSSDGVPLQRMNSADSFRMLSLNIESSKVPNAVDFMGMHWDENEEMAPGDFLDEESALFSDLMSPTPREASSSSATSSSSSSAGTISLSPSMAQPVTSSVTATAVEPMSEMIALLESLSPELKMRFVDKLAETVGAQLMANLGTPHAVAQQVESPHRPQGNTSFTLPSGSPAPHIALPLASATVSAFMQSLQSVKQNVPVPNVSEQIVQV